LLLLLPHPLLTLLLLLLPHLLLRKLPSNIFYIAKKKPPCGGFFSSLMRSIEPVQELFQVVGQHLDHIFGGVRTFWQALFAEDGDRRFFSNTAQRDLVFHRSSLFC